MKKKKLKVAVGISGGVDSSVAAYLLKKEGYEVHGVFVKTWSPEWLPCTWVEEKRDAMRVCAQLNIPFHFFDAEESYKKGVADYMIAEYRAGRTPNPDVLCNRVIKFGALWEYAQSIGADAIATGHYANVAFDENKEIFSLCKGGDEKKDQSYFLWMLRGGELEHILFPIGHLQKDEVRTIAKNAGLFTASKKDSQGICFLGDVDMREFLLRYIEQKAGAVTTLDGTVVGTHNGVWFYTIGERHGFSITTPNDTREPYYVVGKDIETNTLIVSTKEERKLFEKKSVTITLRDSNWIVRYRKNKKYTAQIRYHGAFHNIKIIDDHTVVMVEGEVVPLGQSLVVYENNILIGGGVIDKIQ